MFLSNDIRNRTIKHLKSKTIKPMDSIKYKSNFTARTNMYFYPLMMILYLAVLVKAFWSLSIKNPEMLFNALTSFRAYIPLIILYILAGKSLYSYQIRESGIWIQYHLFWRTRKLLRKDINHIVFDDTKTKFRSKRKGIMHIGVVLKSGKTVYLNNDNEISLLIKTLRKEDYRLKINAVRTILNDYDLDEFIKKVLAETEKSHSPEEE